jgi:hypothetical protein
MFERKELLHWASYLTELVLHCDLDEVADGLEKVCLEFLKTEKNEPVAVSE